MWYVFILEGDEWVRCPGRLMKNLSDAYCSYEFESMWKHRSYIYMADARGRRFKLERVFHFFA